jgi:hypothetical protein
MRESRSHLHRHVRAERLFCCLLLAGLKDAHQVVLSGAQLTGRQRITESDGGGARGRGDQSIKKHELQYIRTRDPGEGAS